MSMELITYIHISLKRKANAIIKIFAIISSLFVFNSCYLSEDEPDGPAFSVVNLTNSPIYVEVVADHTNPSKEQFHKKERIHGSSIWQYRISKKNADDYLDMKFYQNYPELKFTIMGVNSDGSCNYDRILDVIEVNQAQFFYLHRSIYYPLSDRDKQIIEKYK